MDELKQTIRNVFDIIIQDKQLLLYICELVVNDGGRHFEQLICMYCVVIKCM